jgi:nucleotide-binding universal stress UspA family protein
MKMEEESKNAAHDLLMEIAKDFQAQKIHIRAIALVGDPRDALEQKINSLKPTMVVISARGLGAVKRFFMGSTSQHLVHHLKVPVIVLPPVSEAH